MSLPGDELQRLSETLNGMLERLESAFKRITQFTADASHELRSPVALMRTRAELSLRKPRTDSDYREALTEILKELERTSDLIEKLMLLARSDSGSETVQRVPVNLVDSVRQACNQGRTLAEAKQTSGRARQIVVVYER